MPHRRVLFEPQASQAMLSGFNALANALQVTLGPKGRLVGMAQDNPAKAPELLSDGALIARRFTGFPNRFQTMGTFAARHIAWQVEEAVGDGATTVVVIARRILNDAARHVAAGYNPMQLRRGLEQGVAAVDAHLNSLVSPLSDPDQIAAMGSTITGSPELGQLLEEIFDVVGPSGAIDIRRSYSRRHERQYIQGAFWNKGWVSSHFVTEAGKAVLEKPYLLFTDAIIHEGKSLIPILEKVKAEGQGRGLVVMAVEIQHGALNVLVANKAREILPTLAIAAPEAGPEKTLILEDLAALCGGRVFYRHADDLTQATLADLGQADRVEAIQSGCTIVGGKGRPAVVRSRVQALQQQMAKTTETYARNRLLERAGKLMGGVALLKVGGATDVERDNSRERAQEAVQVIRLGLQNGVVPGGGAAFLACHDCVSQLRLSDEEAPVRAILHAALDAPMRAILENAGHEAEPILQRVREAPCGAGYDILENQITDMVAAHIVDPLDVVRTAWRTGTSGALAALTTEVLVHRPRDNRSEEVKLNP